MDKKLILFDDDGIIICLKERLKTYKEMFLECNEKVIIKDISEVVVDNKILLELIEKELGYEVELKN